jgi:hypothetical protein
LETAARGRRSASPRGIPTAGKRREGTCPHASQSGEAPDDGWSDELWIKTSPKVRKLQRVLYLKAKAGPRWRFYSLYDELYRRDVLIPIAWSRLSSATSSNSKASRGTSNSTPPICSTRTKSFSQPTTPTRIAKMA